MAKLNPQEVCWERAADICPEESYKFSVGGAASNDVVQGKLGDCWFIGSLSVMATRDDLLIGIDQDIKSMTPENLD